MSYINPNEMGFGDTAALDAFQRLRTSQAYTLFDSQQEYGLDTLRVWDCTANGVFPTRSTDSSVSSASNAVGPRSANTRMTPITSSATDTHYAILQSSQYTRYIPGKAHLVLMTGIFATNATHTTKIVIRTSTSGSASDASFLAQANWNIDQFDGTGPSGITLDLTKTQILFIGAQWLGVGRVIVGFDINGRLYPAASFVHANILAVPYTQTFNLPVRYEARTAGATTIARVGYFDGANGVFLETTNNTAGGTIQAICASVQSEGGVEARGFPMTANRGITRAATTTRRPVFSIRPAATFNSVTNRAHIALADFWINATSNNALYELVLGGTLTGASWTAITDSCAEFDTAATAIAGGTTTVSGFINNGTGSSAGPVASGEADIRSPLTLRQIDALAATQQAISIVCTSETGTSNILAGMNWHEQTV